MISLYKDNTNQITKIWNFNSKLVSFDIENEFTKYLYITENDCLVFKNLYKDIYGFYYDYINLGHIDSFKETKMNCHCNHNTCLIHENCHTRYIICPYCGRLTIQNHYFSFKYPDSILDLVNKYNDQFNMESKKYDECDFLKEIEFNGKIINNTMDIINIIKDIKDGELE